jgi:hypothetical protein
MASSTERPVAEASFGIQVVKKYKEANAINMANQSQSVGFLYCGVSSAVTAGFFLSPVFCKNSSLSFKNKYTTGITITETIPATLNIACQPYCGIIVLAAMPDNTAPIG